MCVCCVTYKGGILVETGLRKIFKALGKISCQDRRRRFWNVEEDSHRVHVGVGRFSFGEFDGSDAQRPNVRLRGRHKALVHQSLPDQSSWSVGSPTKLGNAKVRVDCWEIFLQKVIF